MRVSEDGSVGHVTYDGLADKGFSFINIPRLAAKPRTKGLTIAADKGLGRNAIADLMENAGDFIDWVKISISTVRIYNPEFIQAKIDQYHASGVKCVITGDLFEASVLQGVHEKYFAAVREVGADAVEVSSAQISLSLDAKCELIKCAANKYGLTVVGEVGEKGTDDWGTHTKWVLKQAERYFAAGAWKVLVQGEGIVENVETMNTTLLLDVAAQYDLNEIIFQAKDTRSQFWYLRNFGPEVNLDVDVDQVVGLQLSRLGIRKRGLFALMANVPQE